MIVEFDKSFFKSLSNVSDKKIKLKIKIAILEFEKASNLAEVSNCKKLVGYSTYYRKRINDYRIGFELTEQNHIRFILFSHRKNIYKNFP